MPTPEQLVRENIDGLQQAVRWLVQDYQHLNLGAGLGVAVRDYPTNNGPADYILFVDRQAVGVVEPKLQPVAHIESG